MNDRDTMVLMCKYCGKKGGIEGRTLHKFPLKDAELLKVWLQKMNLGTSFVPTSSTRICSEHFTKECFDKKDTRTFLRVGSIPTLFREYRTTCAYCNAIQDDDKNVSFRKFPLNNPELVEKWISVLKLGNYIPHSRSIICTKHFSKDCFYTARTGYLRLKENAVPSILETTEDTQAHNSEDQAATAEESTANCTSMLSEIDIEMYNDENCISDNSITEIVMQEHDSEERPSTSLSQCNVTPRSLKRKRNCKHDHSYDLSPSSMRRKISHLSATVKRLRAESKVHNRRIKRLKNKITSLNDLVSELRRTKAIPEVGLRV
ncbi:THAP domain-containing protein 1-like [Ceratina calcarata]|uniref:THAP domain-containing protein 1-like n=1 Tax=Ceratina calcarata TaxID=156304 RepID=A0AAJ7NAY0_9HYME|nr:THAP domain-containing protein 1-like [Ceratina calcarata]